MDLAGRAVTESIFWTLYSLENLLIPFHIVLFAIKACTEG